jgi:multiple sugar transport system substrate-binding protein
MSKTFVRNLAVLLLLLAAAGFAAAGGQPQAAASTAPIEMRYTSWYTGESGELEGQVVNWWNAENPTRTVTALRVDWGAYREKLFTMIAGGDSPDIAAIDTWWSQEFFSRGACVPLQQYVDRDKMDLKTFREGFLEENISAIDGKLYGLPWGPGRNLLFYQDELFRKNGLREPYKGWTTDEWRAAGKKLTQDRNGDGIIDLWGTTRYASLLSISIHGTDYVTADGKQNITSPQFIQALQFVLDNTNVHKMQPTAAESSAIIAGGQDYNTAAFATWHRYEGHVGQSIKSGLPAKISYRVSYEPMVQGQPVTTLQKGNTMCIMSASKNQAAAWDFMKYYFSDKPQAYLAEIGLYPSTRSAEATAAYRHPPAYPAIDLEPAINPGRIHRLPFSRAGFIEANTSVIDPAISSVLVGDKTPQAAMQEAAPEVTRLLNEGAARRTAR